VAGFDREDDLFAFASMLVVEEEAAVDALAGVFSRGARS